MFSTYIFPFFKAHCDGIVGANLRLERALRTCAPGLHMHSCRMALLVLRNLLHLQLLTALQTSLEVSFRQVATRCVRAAFAARDPEPFLGARHADEIGDKYDENQTGRGRNQLERV